MTELISDGGQMWAVPAVADALQDMFRKDPDWSVFNEAGYRQTNGEHDDDRVCPECGALWGFIWMRMWGNRATSMWANIDTLSCPNGHYWNLVAVPPVDIDQSGLSGADWVTART
jgi:hypothetical protein